MNTFSTDSQGGFPCFATRKAEQWLRNKDVRTALHIPQYIQPFRMCNWPLHDRYSFQHMDSSPFFDTIISSSSLPLSILIYNGDLDLACNSIGDQWFIEGVAQKNGLLPSREHSPWMYRQQVAGYAKQFSSPDGQVTIDLLTVKGAGHFVPMDRPGPALQMITSFLAQRDYSIPVLANTQPTQLKMEYRIKEGISVSTSPASAASSSNPHHSLKLKQIESLAAAPPAPLPRRRRPPPPPPIDPPPVNETKELDRITSLPGSTFPLPDMYSGYLNASTGADDGVNLHYWLIMSQVNPISDPLILWLNGGPGCSSLGGLFSTLGPFKVTPDGKLIENVFGWTKVGSVLFLEAPSGVGFSYTTTTNQDSSSQVVYNDQMTATQNVEALKSFFARFPEFNNRRFIISGESYAGVYIPTLTNALLKAQLPYINLVGVAIGNGEMSLPVITSSAVQLAYYKGFMDLGMYKRMGRCCPPVTSPDPNGYMAPCDLSQYVDMSDQGIITPKPSNNASFSECALLVQQWGFYSIWTNGNDPYNTYLDCYGSGGGGGGDVPNPNDQDYYHYDYPVLEEDGGGGGERRREGRARRFESFHFPGTVLTNDYTFIDEAKLLNPDSTDPFFGHLCNSDLPIQSYLQRPDVQKALHVNITGLPPWQDCSFTINNNYVQQNHDTTQVFKQILAQTSKDKPLAFLIFNGDADRVCDFMSSQVFIESLASQMVMKTISERQGWNYTRPSSSSTTSYLPRLGGFSKVLQYKDQATFQLLTIKGGGHAVGNIRPGPMLQAMFNFVNQKDPSVALSPSLVQTSSTLPTTTTTSTSSTKASQDKVFSLPGLTFTPTFGHHSGYVRGAVKGNYLFYWMVEPQISDWTNATVLLWLTGGPGCSSIGGMMSENGPFRVNPDGRTLYENIHSWNKAAFVIYLDSPRLVGFSYQDMKQNPSHSWSDDLTRMDVAAALVEIYSTYPQMLAGRDFYITGESYAGVYIPLVAMTLMDNITSGTGPKGMQFKGFAIGNGYFSQIWDMATMIDFLYFHGILSQQTWDNSRRCCDPLDQFYCNITFTEDCVELFFDAWWSIWGLGIDTYNIYQQCYSMVDYPDFAQQHHQGKEDLYRRMNFGKNATLNKAKFNRMHKEKLFQRMQTRGTVKAQSPSPTTQSSSLSQQALFNYQSNDQTGGYQCYSDDAINAYLNLPYVREALHVPIYVQPWNFCSGLVGWHYNEQYNNDDNDQDMNGVFQYILQSDYVSSLPSPFKMLIYNGDVDLMCDFIEGEFFIDEVVQQYQGNVSVTVPRQEWLYSLGDSPQQGVAGFRKSFDFGGGKASLDLLTVKGSGHFVPVDRAGPALQMLYNFIGSDGLVDYNATLSSIISPRKRQPLKEQFLPNPPIPPANKQPTTTISSTSPSTRTPPSGATTSSGGGGGGGGGKGAATTSPSPSTANETTTTGGASTLVVNSLTLSIALIFLYYS